MQKVPLLLASLAFVVAGQDATGQATLSMQPLEARIPYALTSTDPAIKNSIAYQLAKRNRRLSDAQTLAEQAVTAVEKNTAKLVQEGDYDADYKQSILLTSYWDTLGWVFYRQGNQQKAETYVLAAWNLKPNPEYALHLGSIYEAQSRPRDAATIYRMALSRQNSPAWKTDFQARLAHLGDPHAEPIAMEVVTSLRPSAVSASFGATEPVVEILISADGPATVTYLNGQPAHGRESLTPAIQSAVSQSLPDTGPEIILRRARVSCSAGRAGCALHFLTPSK